MSEETKTHFRCDGCGHTFRKERRDEDARVEERDLFGASAGKPDRAIVCDACWRDFMRAYAQSGGAA